MLVVDAVNGVDSRDVAACLEVVCVGRVPLAAGADQVAVDVQVVLVVDVDEGRADLRVVVRVHLDRVDIGAAVGDRAKDHRVLSVKKHSFDKDLAPHRPRAGCREVDAASSGLVGGPCGRNAAGGAHSVDSVDLDVQRPRRVVVGQRVCDGDSVLPGVARVQAEGHRVASWISEVREAKTIVPTMADVASLVAARRADHLGDRGIMDAAALVGAGEPLLVRVEALAGMRLDELLADAVVNAAALRNDVRRGTRLGPSQRHADLVGKKPASSASSWCRR